MTDKTCNKHIGEEDMWGRPIRLETTLVIMIMIM
jgi:hypothetical protein